MKSTEEIKQIVKEKYGSLALSGGCCGATGGDCCSAGEAGYTHEQVSGIPSQANAAG